MRNGLKPNTITAIPSSSNARYDRDQHHHQHAAAAALGWMNAGFSATTPPLHKEHNQKRFYKYQTCCSLPL
jgi:hypothetical protein